MSTGKVVAKGLLLVDMLQYCKGSQCHSYRRKSKIFGVGVLLHQENTPAHKSTMVMAAIQECNQWNRQTTTFLPIFFFQMKKEHSGCHFDDSIDDDFIVAVDIFLEVQDTGF